MGRYRGCCGSSRLQCFPERTSIRSFNLNMLTAHLVDRPAGEHDFVSSGSAQRAVDPPVDPVRKMLGDIVGAGSLGAGVQKPRNDRRGIALAVDAGETPRSNSTKNEALARTGPGDFRALSMDLYETGSSSSETASATSSSVSPVAAATSSDETKVGVQASLAVGHQEFGDHRTPRPSNQPLQRSEIGNLGQDELQPHSVNVGNQRREVFIGPQSGTRGTVARRGMAAQLVTSTPQRSAMSFETPALVERRRHRSPRLPESFVMDVGVSTTTKSVQPQPLFHVAGGCHRPQDFPIVEPDIDPFLHEALGRGRTIASLSSDPCAK